MGDYVSTTQGGPSLEEALNTIPENQLPYDPGKYTKEERYANSDDAVIDPATTQPDVKLSPAEAAEQAKIDAALEAMGRGVPGGEDEDAKPDEELANTKSSPDGASKSPDADSKPDEKAKDEVKPEVKADEKKEEAKAPDFSKYDKEFIETGAVSEASVAELGKAGITKPMIDAYITGIKATQEAQANEVYAVAGGKDAYEEVVAWGTANFTKPEADAYNEALGKSPEAAKQAVESLVAKHRKAVGGRGVRISGNRGVASNEGIKPFLDKEEWAKARKNPLYRQHGAKGDAYRDTYNKRTAISKGNI